MRSYEKKFVGMELFYQERLDQDKAGAKLCCIVALLITLALFSSKANSREFYRASPADIPFTQDLIPLNDKTFLYTQTSNSFPQSQTLFSYEIATRESTRLATVRPSQENATSIASAMSNNIRGATKAYLSVNGTLISTDGTPIGTNILGEFGTNSCCEGRQAFSRINNFLIFDNQLYFTFDNENAFAFIDGAVRATSRSVWTSDGTTSGTRQITPSFDVDQVGFLRVISNANGVFYVGADGIFSVNGNHIDPVARLDANTVPAFNDFRGGAPISAGTFRCVSSEFFPDINSRLLQFNNANELIQITSEPCLGSWAVDDRLFYQVGDSFFEFDSSTQSGKLLFTTDMPEFSSMVVCKTEDIINFVTTSLPQRPIRTSITAEYFQLTRNDEILDRSAELQATLSDESNLTESVTARCLDNRIIIQETGATFSDDTEGGSDRTFLFDPKTGSDVATVIRRNNTNHSPDAILFFGPFTDSEPRLLSPTTSPGIVPVISGLLEEEQ